MGSTFYDIAEYAASEGRTSCQFHQIETAIRNSSGIRAWLNKLC